MSVALTGRSGGAAAAWHGCVDLAFRRHGERTVLERRRVEMPLALQRPFYPEGPSVCHALLLHPPGGMVGGDRLEIALDVDAGAAAMVSTPSAAKWYRGLTPAAQAARHYVAPGARLEWLPLETIVFDGAQVRQRTRVELAPGGAWLGWEITRFGRTARGETYDSGTWRADTEVWRDGSPLWIDRQHIGGGSRLMRSRYGLAGAAVVATFAWVGNAVSPDLVAAARAAWDALGSAGDAGATRLEEGLVCRYRGSSSADARVWFTAVWNLVRGFDGRSTVSTPRIWMT